MKYGFSQGGVVHPAQHPLGRKMCERLGEPVHPSPFMVEKNQGRAAGLTDTFGDLSAELLKLSGRLRIAGEQNDPGGPDVPHHPAFFLR